MTQRSNCARYHECLADAAHDDAWDVRCDLCGDYTPAEIHPTTDDLAGCLCLAVYACNPDLAERLPSNREWRWDLLALFHHVAERNEQLPVTLERKNQ